MCEPQDGGVKEELYESMKQVINLSIENLNAWHVLNLTSKQTTNLL
jgi:hypothetical protein